MNLRKEKSVFRIHDILVQYSRYGSGSADQYHGSTDPALFVSDLN
jgi:hypothetical protein